MVTSRLPRRVGIARRILTVFLTLSFFLQPIGLAKALDTSKESFLNNKTYNNLIDDTSFIDINAMDEGAIQKFLDDQQSPLRDYSENGRSAAKIIYDAAHGANEAGGSWGGISITTTTGTVSPRVILTYLEKEQSLVSRDDRPEATMNKAMGYQCYNGAANDNNGNTCNDRYEGFTLQVENAAWQLRYNYEYAKRGTKPSGFATHYVVNESASIPEESKYGGKSYDIKMENAATASIYSYTPYVFDSSYNFWKIFNGWFTASPPAPPAESTDDTTKFTLKTYISSITVGGTKSSASSVFFNNQPIATVGSTSWQLTFEAEDGAKTYTVEYRDAAGQVSASKAIEIDKHKTADINGDSNVDIQDLSILANYWGQDHPGEALANLNPGEDEVVDIQDISILASNWNG